ncbi:MAG: tetratricopeptide repeat protein [Alphaproteobacteria bacterium]|nr:tetratricopeptide repeat protein [Alphaproteobacteria bacterium]
MSSNAYQTGLRLAERGRHSEAIAAFESALAQKPDDTRVLYALAGTARRLGLPQVARGFYGRVLALEPERIEAVNGLAQLLCETNEPEGALELLGPFVERYSDCPELRVTLGNALRQLDRPEEAEAAFRAALALSPTCAPALGNLADCLADRGEITAALALYDRLLSRDRDHHTARLNRAILHFLRGDLKPGWRDYAARLKLAGKAPRPLHRLTAWSGGTLRNTRLLITAEQGVGDQIMFASLIPELSLEAARQGGRLLLECDPRLEPLFARSFPKVAVHAAHWRGREGVVEAHYDWLAARGGASAAIALGSLGRYLRPDVASFPRPHAYLAAEPAEQKRWQDWYGTLPKGRRFGICWRSGKLGGGRALQYAPLAAWAELMRETAGEFVCVQYDAQSDEIATLERLSGRTLHVPPSIDQKQELDRCAALLSCLDVVISAPTAVSWLAAALGVATLKPLYATSWTGFGTNYEPFAPAARLIEPDLPGDWSQCFAKIREALS